MPDLGLVGRAGLSVMSDDPRADGGGLPSWVRHGRFVGVGFARKVIVVRWEVDRGVRVVPGRHGCEGDGGVIHVGAVVSGVVVCSVVGGSVTRWVVCLLALPFGVKAGEGSVDAFAMFGVGVSVRSEGVVVAAGSAVVGVVDVAIRVVADKTFAFGAASEHVVDMANVAMLWGTLFRLLWG